MPVFRHIRTRVTVVFLLLLAGALGAVLLAVYRASLANARGQVEAQFNLAGKALAQLQAQRTALLRQGVEVLAANSAFRQAVQAADLDAMETTLSAQAGRLKAEMATLVSLDGRVLANTRFPATFGGSFPCSRMIRVAEAKGGASGYARIENQVHQLVLAPVMAPKPVAWLALGLPVNDAVAAEYQALTGVGVNFMSMGDGRGRLLASSLPDSQRREVGAWLEGFHQEGAGMQRVRLSDGEYWAHFVKLDSDSALDYVAVLTLSVDAALAPHERLRGTLLGISALALLAFLYGAAFLSRRLTLPLQELLAGLRRVGRGHFDTRVILKSRDELGALAEGFNRMAGDIAARERQVTYLAYHDTLTGLQNRASLVKHVNADLAAGKGAVMLVACLARLRVINVNLGFAVTDALLKAVAQRILGRDDWQVASLGGERLAFYCPLAQGLERDDWEVRVRAVLDVPVEWQGQRFDLGLRLGSALAPRDGRDAELLLRRAEQAMQHGARTLGAHVAWQAAFEEGGARRLALLNDLRGAIDSGQLVACYQPKARLMDGRVVACELLVRWHHPVHGVVRPEEFIPAAEQSTLIGPLARWAIDSAAAQAAAWRAAGRELAVSVNLSARNLEDHEVVEQIANALARHGLPPETLMMEITESALMEDPETALGVVNAIAGLGVGLAVDDFGAGYSSLSQLSRLPVRELKIDRGFVARMLASGQDAAIVKSIIDLAHTLGLSVVAEGVDTAEAWQRLVAYGCDQVQGDHLLPPVEAAELDVWLMERGA